jgi:pSer/pThr/pTyr-binding forkhead associated (FHA) protein
MFAGKTTGPLQRNLNQTAYFKPKSRLIIHVQDASDPLIFNVDSIRSLLIGRTQPNAGEPVDINLHSYDGLNQGVSRQHAEIVWKRGALHIVDRGSANGTYLNDQRLEADEPHILHDGDSLRLGQLRLGIMLVDSEK